MVLCTTLERKDWRNKECEVSRCSTYLKNFIMHSFMKHNHVLTCHHLLSQANWGTNKPNNLIMLRENFHRWIHSVFDAQTPIQQQRSLLELNKRVMSPDVYWALSNTLKQYEGLIELNCYEPWCIDEDKFIKRFYNTY